MQFDLSPFFKEYEQLVQTLDGVFSRIQEQFPEEVKCRPGCCECCYALFDVSLVEAMHINRQFHQVNNEQLKEQVLELADKADRDIHKIKHKAFKARQQGVDPEDIMQEIGKQQVRCPLLDKDNGCVLYSKRPVTCRVYGLPLKIHGQVRTCGHTGFETGRAYPSINMDSLQDRLMDISKRMVQAMPTKYSKLHEVLVPVSMALLTEYNDEYLGIMHLPKTEQATPGMEWTLGSADED